MVSPLQFLVHSIAEFNRKTKVLKFSFLKLWLFLIAVACVSPLDIYAQVTNPSQGAEGSHSQHSVCLNDSKRAEIQSIIRSNIKLLEKQGYVLNASRNTSMTLAFDWPLRAASSLTFNSYFATNNFVDQDTGPGLLDYNCNARTYNGHRGTDYDTWPFPKYLYENDLVEVIASEAGLIIAKDDGNFDQNCSFNSSDWNAVYLLHADGSETWYGHLKAGSLTTKQVGQSVAKGEYLGVVASSGNSTQAHLHFEVYDPVGNLIDPYAGTCNSLNTASWWASQPLNRESTLNALLTHSAFPDLTCASETPYFSNDFNPGATVFFGTYYKDELNGDVSVMRILRPDNSVWVTWNRTSASDYNSSAWISGYTLPLAGPFGTWTFEVDYNGETFQHQFEYGTVPAPVVSGLQISPVESCYDLTTQVTVTAQVTDATMAELSVCPTTGACRQIASVPVVNGVVMHAFQFQSSDIGLSPATLKIVATNASGQDEMSSTSFTVQSDCTPIPPPVVSDLQVSPQASCYTPSKDVFVNASVLGATTADISVCETGGSCRFITTRSVTNGRAYFAIAFLASDIALSSPYLKVEATNTSGQDEIQSSTFTIQSFCNPNVPRIFSFSWGEVNPSSPNCYDVSTPMVSTVSLSNASTAGSVIADLYVCSASNVCRLIGSETLQNGMASFNFQFQSSDVALSPASLKYIVSNSTGQDERATFSFPVVLDCGSPNPPVVSTVQLTPSSSCYDLSSSVTVNAHVTNATLAEVSVCPTVGNCRVIASVSVVNDALSHTFQFQSSDIGLSPATLKVVAVNSDGQDEGSSSSFTIQASCTPIPTCPLPGATLTKQDAGCNQTNGSLTVVLPIGASSTDFTYALNGGVSQAGSTFSNLAAGQYSIEIESTTLPSCSETIAETISEVDNIAPQASCADISVALDSDGTLMLDLNALGGGSTDNCGAPVLSASISEVTCTDVGTPIQVTITASDGLQSSTCTSLVTVTDQTPPTFSDVPLSMTIDCDASVPTTFPTASDACGIASLTEMQTTSPGSCPSEQIIQRIFTAVDNNGNSATSTQIVTIIDDVAPIITSAPAALTLNCEDAVPSTFAQVVATDNCGQVTITESEVVVADPNCPNASVITRTFSAEDECGNISTSSQIITIADVSPPLIASIPPALILNCEDVIPFTLAQVSATDNCGQVTITENDILAQDPNCPNGSVITRTFIASDECGNVTTATQLITIQDMEAPVYDIFPADVTVECSQLAGLGASLTSVSQYADLLPQPQISDNCTTGLVASFSESYVPAPTSICPQLGVYTRIYNAVDDGCGNTLASRTWTITIEDTTAPEFSHVPANVDIDCASALPTDLPSVDDCDPNVSISVNDQVTTVEANGIVEIITRMFITTDLCGNSNSVSQEIKILDSEVPQLVFATPTPTEVVAQQGPEVVVNYMEPVFTDNCDFTVTTNWPYGQPFPVGTTIVTYTAIDRGGNTVSHTFEVIVLAGVELECCEYRSSATVNSASPTISVDVPAATVLCDQCPVAADIDPGFGQGHAYEYLGEFEGHRYYLSEAPLGYFNAQGASVAMNGELAVLDSPDELRFLSRELAGRSGRVGLTRNRGVWSWVRGGLSITNINWTAGADPQAQDLNTAVLRSDGTFDPVDVSGLAYIVEVACIDFEEQLYYDRDGNFIGADYTATSLCGYEVTCSSGVTGLSGAYATYCQPDDNTSGATASVEMSEVVINANIHTSSLASGQHWHPRDTVRFDAGADNLFVLDATSHDERSWPSYYRVWIDVNGDKDFDDAGELIQEIEGSASVGFSVAVPLGFGVAPSSRIRIAVGRYDYPEVCCDMGHATYHDFPLEITPSTQPIAPIMLRGVLSWDNEPNLSWTVEHESPATGEYLLLRGESVAEISKYRAIQAAQPDQSLAVYDYDDDQALAADNFYQVLSLNHAGYILAQSNVARVTRYTRRSPTKFFPNPAKDRVFFNFNEADLIPGDYGIAVIDLTGKVLVKHPVKVTGAGLRSVQVDLRGIATGAYLLNFRQNQTGELISSDRLVIARDSK